MWVFGDFARRSVIAAACLAVGAVGFALWREPTYLLTSIQGAPPLAPLYARWLPTLRASGLSSLLVLAGAVWLLRRPPQGTAAFLALALVFSIGFRFSVHALRSDELPGREIATYAGEAVVFDVARIGSISGFLGDYTEIQPELSLHGRTKPPGAALFYYGLIAWLGRDLQRLGIAVTLLGSALVIPAFFIGRSLGGVATARSVALLSASVPSATLYGAVTLDAVFAVVAGSAVALALDEAAAPRRWKRLALGGVWFAAAMLSYSAALAVLLCGGVIFFARRESVLRRLAALAEAAIACLLPLLALRVFSGFDIVASFAAARELNALAMGAATGRDLSSAAVWLYASLGNGLAFALYLGVPALAGLSGLRDRDLAGSLGATAAALTITLCVACFGGLYLMETERILLFLVPPTIGVAARARDFDARFALVVSGLQSVAFEIALYTIW